MSTPAKTATAEARASHEADNLALPTIQVQGYEVSNTQPLPEDVQDDMDRFVDREATLARQAHPNPGEDRHSPQYETYRTLTNAALNHGSNWANVRDQLGMSRHEDFSPANAADKGLVLIARDPDTDQIVGFSSALLTQDEEGQESVTDNYVGAGANAGRGIGGSLVLLRDRLLAERGITSYVASVWRGSERMYQRIGASYTEVPEEDDLVSSSRKLLLITLDPDHLEQQCAEQLQMDQDADILEGPVEVTVNPRRLGSSVLAATGIAEQT